MTVEGEAEKAQSHDLYRNIPLRVRVIPRDTDDVDHSWWIFINLLSPFLPFCSSLSRPPRSTFIHSLLRLYGSSTGFFR